MLSFSSHTHRRARTYCCPHGPHRHSPPLPGKAGWRGIKPSLDVLLDVAAPGSEIKTGSATRTRVQMSYDAGPLKVSVR
jgi:hypothetical protein